MSTRGVFSKGQALVEYALILVLGAVVVIVITVFLGRGIQRIFGIVVATLGQKYGTDSLNIGYAECFVHTQSQTTGLWVRGLTSYPLSDLSGSTDKGTGGDIDQNDQPGPSNAPTGDGTFKYTVSYLEHSGDRSVCPKAVVIQAKNGAMAAYPVHTVEGP